MYETQKSRLPRTLLPQTPTALLSLRLMNHTLLRRPGERQSLRIWVWSAEKLQELLCPASFHLTALSFRDSQILTCFLHASHCSTTRSHCELPFVPSPASIRQVQFPLQGLSSFHPVSRHGALNNPLWTGCLKIYTNCDVEHRGLQCTAEQHQ